MCSAQLRNGVAESLEEQDPAVEGGVFFAGMSDRFGGSMKVAESTERGHFLYGKEVLLNLPGRDGTYLSGNPRHEPGDPTHPGVTREQGH